MPAFVGFNPDLKSYRNDVWALVTDQHPDEHIMSGSTQRNPFSFFPKISWGERCKIVIKSKLKNFQMISIN